MNPELQALTINLVILVVPYAVAGLAAFISAWLRSRLLAIEAANVAQQVEIEALYDPELRGDRKLARARELLTERTRGLVALRPDSLIERALPSVRSRTGGPPST